ncbi:hypothetical protein D3C75_136390 [compost metagenome]
MFSNAIKMYLMSLGIDDVENWSKEELMNYLDATFKVVQRNTPEDLEPVIDETVKQIGSHMQMLREVLEQ